MSLVPILTKLASVQQPPALLSSLPVGYPVHLVRDWQYSLNPYVVAAWLHYFSYRIQLGVLPSSISHEVATHLDSGKVVSTYLLQYVRVGESPPIVMLKIEVQG